MMRIFFQITLLFCLLFAETTVFGQTDVLTQHNDFGRTGWNQTESQLNVSNVTPAGFGLLGSRPVDNQIYSQPLIASGVSIAGSSKNVVYVTTVNNTVYAFDADDASIPAYWTINLTHTSRRPPIGADIHSGCGLYNDFSLGTPGSGVFGIVGTPVIDRASNTIYLVSRDVDPTLVDQSPNKNDPNYYETADGFYQYLHAIDISTGLEKTGSPVLISAIAAGAATGSVNNILTFDARRQNQRGGLLLLNGIIYIPYATHCDWDNYNGWVLAYDATTLIQKTAYVTSPNDNGGGIWMSGGGIAADPAANNGNGSIYFSAGNSGRTDPAGAWPTTQPSILQNRGEGIIKLNPDGKGSAFTTLTIGDYFTPYNYQVLNSSDLDFGTQVMLVPNSNLLVAGCKDYNLYTFDKTNLGGYDPAANHNLQKIFVTDGAGMHTAFAYFGGTTNKYFYQFGENTNLKAYAVSGNLLSTSPISGVGNGPLGQSGSMMSTSSNGSDESTGILWISHPEYCNSNQGLCPGILRAVNAANPTQEIWNSDINPNDAVGAFSKNACPTIANGKVYLATFSNKLNIYGLLASNPQCTVNIALNKTATDNIGNVSSAQMAIDGDVSTGWYANGLNNDWLQINLGAASTICRISILWADANSAAKDFLIQTSASSNGPWTTVQSVTGNTALSNAYNLTATGTFVRIQGVTMSVSNYRIIELAIYGAPIPTCLPPTGTTVSNITTSTADISWAPVANAQSYLLRYKPNLVSSFVTRTITAGTSQSLSALSCGFDYNVDIQSVCSTTDSSSFVTIPISTAVCVTACTLPTRYNHFDLGDIGMAGRSCAVTVSGPPVKTIFTIDGSGGDIGGNNDQFQFAETDLAGDQTLTARLTSQDNLGSNKAGIMMRDSLSNTSRFAYVGLTQGVGAQFIYRTTPGGPATVMNGPSNIAVPFYFQLVKSGNLYTASISPDATNGSWTTIGTADLGFGSSSSVKQGFAVTSADNTKLSTAVFELSDQSTPLPVTLVSFTARNINNQYIGLKWITATEENNNYFLLERSADGSSFETLAKIGSQGNSSTNQEYNYSDNHPVNGINFYRIKQYDLDGKLTIYPVAMAKFGAGGIPLAYPNPASSVIHILSADQTVKTAVLYDLTGKELQRMDNILAGTTTDMRISGLPAGTYILKLSTPDKIYQQKIMKE